MLFGKQNRLSRALLVAASLLAALLVVPNARAVSSTTFVNSQGGAGNFRTIQAGIAAVGNKVSAGSCTVTIEGGGPYTSSVTVEGISLSTCTTILIAPVASTTPVVNPTGGTAAFFIAQASTIVSGFKIIPTAALTYGVYVSSPYVQLSSMDVIDPAGHITSAGIVASSWTAISYSSVTVSAASGFWLPGSTMTQVSHSSASARSATDYALWLNDASSNTFTVFLASNPTGIGAYLDPGSAGNTLTQSSFTSNAANGYGLFLLNADSNTFTRVYANNSTGTGVAISTGSNNNSITGGTFAINTAGYFALYLVGAPANTITQSVVSNSKGTAAYLDTNSDGNTLSQSSFTGNAAGSYGLFLFNADSNTIENVYANNGAGTGIALSTGSNNNLIASSTFAINTAGYPALYLVGAPANTITQSVVSNSKGTAAYLDVNSDGNTLSQSSFTGNAAGSYGLFLFNADSNTIENVYANNGAGTGIALSTGSNNNAISGSTFIINTAGYPALYLVGAPANTITGSFASNPKWTAGYLDVGSNGNTLDQSSFTSNTGGAYGLILVGSSSNTLEGVYAGNASGDGIVFSTGSNWNDADQGYFASDAAGYYGLYMVSASSNAVTNGYIANPKGTAAYLRTASYNSIDGTTISGTTASYVSGSTGTAIGGSALSASATTGDALWFGNGSVDLALSSSTLEAGTGGAAVFLNAGDGGMIVLSTNVLSGAYGVFAATPEAGTQLWVTSNTILPDVTNGTPGAGLLLIGLQGGATIENNAIYYRTSGTLGAGTTSYGFYANTSVNVLFDHNQISNPGMITGGFFYGAYLTNADNLTFKFNDVYSSAPVLGAAYLMRAGEGSTNLTVKDNIFFSSFTAPSAGKSSGTFVIADLASQHGFAADYNDYYSSNAALGFVWGSTDTPQGLPAWRAASSNDLNSITGHALWAAVSPGVEDFHVFSVTARYDPADGFMDLVDIGQSPTIDAGDPAEGTGAEPGPGNIAANLGSYGLTAQASESATTPLLCPVQRIVDQTGGPYFTIQSAVNSLPAVPTGQACAVIEDGATYGEQVTVSSFTMRAAASVSVFADPASNLTPTVSPPAGTAAFLITDASVSVQGINVVPTNALTYGVYVSSPYAQISNVNVIDPSGKITTAGIVASSWTTISYASVTVGAVGAVGLWLPGSSMTAVSFSSAAATGLNHTRYALWLNDASSNTFTSFFANGSSGFSVYLDTGSSYDTLSQSSFTSNAAGKPTLYLTKAYAALLTGDSVQGSTAVYVSASTGTEIDGSVLTGTGTAGSALWLGNGSVDLTLTSSTLIGGPRGSGLYLNTNDSGVLALSSNIVAGGLSGIFLSTQSAGTILSVSSLTFSGLTAGATAINFGGGQFVSTFTSVYFNGSVAIDVNARPLATGSSVYMLSPAGPNAGPAFADDPHDYVIWPYPGAPSLGPVYASSIAVLDDLSGALGYEVDASTTPGFTALIFSSFTLGGMTSLAPQNLWANTTNYLRVGALWGQTTYYNPTVVSTTTLAAALALGTSEFLLVNSSVTVAWVALPPSPSSMSCEGYTLLASSSPAFDPPLFSSTTFSAAASTLTLTLGTGGVPLDLSNTYYFQIASLNSRGVPNFTSIPPLNFQITQSTNSLSFGSIDPHVALSTVSTSSMVVTNVGNWPVTIGLNVSTSADWGLATSSGVDTAVLMGVWNAAAPPPTLFSTYLTTATRVSQDGGNYSGGQSGYQIPPGQSVSLWFRFFLPATSSTVGPEIFTLSAQPSYP